MIHNDAHTYACPSQVASVEYDNFLGRIAVGRVMNGSIKKGQQVCDVVCVCTCACACACLFV